MRTIGVHTAIIIGFMALGIFNGEAVAQTASPPRRHVVHIEAFAFSPQQITVFPGEIIMWVNKDIVPHFLNIADNQWQSPVIEEGQSWEIVVEQPGSYTYLCMFHPQMTGTLIVN